LKREHPVQGVGHLARRILRIIRQDGLGVEVLKLVGRSALARRHGAADFTGLGQTIGQARSHEHHRIHE
jgi:hypothetical protein